MLNSFTLLFVSLGAAINTLSWKTSLPVVFYGMVGIFIVIGVIVLVTYLLNKITSGKGKK